MAERRMFAKTIVDSDAFLEMPMSARLLYYDLGMRADDDGFVNSPKKIMKIIGASNDDMNILILRKFIIPFDSGVVVIKHWKIHNYIRSDRYKPTPYTKEKSMLEMKTNDGYTLKNGDGIPNGYQRDTQDRLGKDRLDKDSIGKDSISYEEKSNVTVTQNLTLKNNVEYRDKSIDNRDKSIEYRDKNIENNISSISKQKNINEKVLNEEFEKLWQYYPNKKGKEEARKKYLFARKSGTTYEEVANGLKNYIKYLKEADVQQKYVKHGSTWFNQKCWNDDYTITKKNNNTKVDDQMEFLKGVYNGEIKIN